jgi:hypothetical protein
MKRMNWIILLQLFLLTVMPATESIAAGSSLATATVVRLTSVSGLTLSRTISDQIAKPGENDYYRIIITSVGTLGIRTFGSTDTYGYLLNSSGKTLGFNDDYQKTPNFSIVRAVSPGTYYIRVRHFNIAKGTGPYTMLVAFTFKTPLPDDNIKGVCITQEASFPYGSYSCCKDETEAFCRSTGKKVLSWIAGEGACTGGGWTNCSVCCFRYDY